MSRFRIADRWIGPDEPTYFIADVAANHDGDLDRAKMLIRLAAEAGADAAKFQHFSASKIVSRLGFERLGASLSHQAAWSKPVYEVYQDASLPWEWTGELKACCDEAGIHFFTTPYDVETVDKLGPLVPCYKIGSGDVTWLELLARIASKGKPVILSTGASDIGEVQRAAQTVLAVNPELALLQCNTNYTGRAENFNHIHLNVLGTYRTMFPQVVVGLSDHTPGHATVLGAVALGARVIEKHFTDDTTRKGPDHVFSMTPATWREMVDRTRELERALGSAEKSVADNERETVVVQRRCVRSARDLDAGTVLSPGDLELLRPAPPGSIPPHETGQIVGRRLRRTVRAGEHLTWMDLE